MKQKLIGIASVLIIIALGLSLLNSAASFNGYFSLNKLELLNECVDEAYLYETNDVALEQGIYKGFLEGLENEDTYYVTAEEMKTLNDEIVEELSVTSFDNCDYIKLNSVKEGTSETLKEALNDKKSLILDIRNLDVDNMEEIQKICNLFLDETALFRLETRDTGMHYYTSTDGSVTMPIVLIFNQYTKSGAEALALALNERSLSVGSETHGDPYIKRMISFDDGSGMSIAYGKLYDQYGRELTAIAPDVEVSLTREELLELLEQDEITLTEDPYVKLALDSVPPFS